MIEATLAPVKPEPHSPQALALLAARVPAAFDRAVDPVPSPCISICRMNEDRSLCLGCYRSIDEIRAISERADINLDGDSVITPKRTISDSELARAARHPVSNPSHSVSNPSIQFRTRTQAIPFRHACECQFKSWEEDRGGY